MNLAHYIRPSHLPIKSGRVFSGHLESVNLHDPHAPELLVQDLVDFGAICFRTDLFTKRDNDAGLAGAQGYFCRPHDERMLDVPAPELAFQVGLTLRGQEKTRQKYTDFDHLSARNRPTKPPRGGPVSERLMFPIGTRPENMLERFRMLNAIHANPAGVLPFEEDLRMCGESKLRVAVFVMQLLEIGLLLPDGALVDLLTDGPHLEAPNATHLDEDVVLGDVANEVHYDLNLATFFGKANAPGLFVWIAKKFRVALSIPEGCMLMQAGKQLEWLTGGHISYGLHEVVVTKSMIDTLTRSTPRGKPPVRTSLPLFVHVNSMRRLEPLGHFQSAQRAHKYATVLAGDYLIDELTAINLAT